MTLFANRQGQIIAVWNVGDHLIFDDVAAVDNPAAGDVAAALTNLSAVLWQMFDDDCDDCAAAAQRVKAALALPKPVDGSNLYVDSYDPAEAAAFAVARAANGVWAFTRTEIVAQVDVELDAVERAGRGDLTGRARQAVALSPLTAAPNQVAAADQILATGQTRRLFVDVSATAACVAVLGWLHTASKMMTDMYGYAADTVVTIADTIEAADDETWLAALEELAAGDSPDQVVADLLRNAKTRGEPRPAPTLLAHLLRGIARHQQVFVTEQDDDPSVDDDDLDDWVDACDRLFWEQLTARR